MIILFHTDTVAHIYIVKITRTFLNMNYVLSIYMLLWAACGQRTVVCLPCHEVTVAMVRELEMQSIKVFPGWK